MPEVPKIVHERLRAAQPQSSHPDAELLTAFAEQALAASERENVLAHLAACLECREVIALSLPALEVVARSIAVEDKTTSASSARSVRFSPKWLSWPGLHWAAVAAGVVVVASVLMLRNSKHQPSLFDVINEQAELSRPAAAEAKPALPETDHTASLAPPPLQALDKVSPPPARTAKRDEDPRQANAAKPPSDQGRLRQPVSGPVTSLAVEPRSAGRGYAAALAGNKRPDVVQTEKSSAEMAPTVGGQLAGRTTEQVQVPGSEAAVNTEPAAAPVPEDTRILARNEAPVEIKKAKQASRAKNEEEASKLRDQSAMAPAESNYGQPGLMQRAVATKDAAVGAWNLVQGVLFRAEGKTWKVALKTARPLMSFGVYAGEVWTGGQAGLLFHSRDNGTTWTQIQPSAKGESLTSDIVAIDVRSADELVLTTHNNESWSTSDGGKSWEKK